MSKYCTGQRGDNPEHAEAQGPPAKVMDVLFTKIAAAAAAVTITTDSVRTATLQIVETTVITAETMTTVAPILCTIVMS